MLNAQSIYDKLKFQKHARFVKKKSINDGFLKKKYCIPM